MQARKATAKDAYVLEISLGEIEPRLWRSVTVGADTALHKLHRVIQMAMGWTIPRHAALIRSAMRGSSAKYRTSFAFALLGLVGCVPSPGPFRLAAVDGRLVDRESREPIAGAHIFQVYRGAGAPGADPRVFSSRWTQTDARGNFVFVSQIARSTRMWILKTYGPRYDFYHPAYGLVRGPSTEEAEVMLEGSLDQAEQRRMDLQVFCSSTADDPGSRRLREVACPRREAR